MTVAELIAELQKLNPDMKVYGESQYGEWELKPEELIPVGRKLILGAYAGNFHK